MACADAAAAVWAGLGAARQVFSCGRTNIMARRGVISKAALRGAAGGGEHEKKCLGRPNDKPTGYVYIYVLS